MKIILNIFLLLCFTVSSQTLTYSYIDPCTGSLKKLEVPSNGVTITYYNQIKTFSKTEIINGSFETWASNVFAQYGQKSPCGTAVGLTGALDIAQGTAINVIGLLNSLSAISDMQAGFSSEAAGGGMLDITSFVGSAQSSSKKEEKKEENNSQTQGGSQNGSTSNPNSENNGTTTGNNNNQSSEGNTQSNSGNNGSGTTQNSNSSTNSSTNVQGGNSGTSDQPTESGGSQTQSPVENKSESTQEGKAEQGDTFTPGGNEKETPKAPNQTPTEATDGEKKSSNLLGGAVSSIANASGKSEGNKPTVIVSSDFTGFNFKNNDVVYGGKVTGGFTSMRWDGRRTHGILMDYTSLIKGPNATAFYAFVGKKRIDLISVTGTAGFVGRGSLYGTVALGQMWNLRKNAKVIYLATTSLGQVYQEKFLGTAFITGGMYDWKIGPRIDVKTMGLFIYAPFVSYYNDIVLKSPYVVMPIMGVNIGVTKKFKFNINLGGTYAIKEDVMNFTIMCGTRFAL